jgi:hypothetical protein
VATAFRRTLRDRPARRFRPSMSRPGDPRRLLVGGGRRPGFLLLGRLSLARAQRDDRPVLAGARWAIGRPTADPHPSLQYHLQLLVTDLDEA